MVRPSQKSFIKAAAVLLLLMCYDLSFSPAEIITPRGHGPKVYFYYNNPLHPSVYRIVKGSVTGVQNIFHDHNHNTITKDEEFTVLLNFSLLLYNKEREWYEVGARFCYGKDIEDCVRNQTSSYIKPYLVRPSSNEVPVPFVVPFSKIHNATLPDGRTVFEAGTVHEQFNTFKVNGAEYDTSSGILVRFSVEVPEKAGKISGIEFLREQGRTQQHQPLVQCHFVEWIADGCVPGLDNLMAGYDVKFMQLRGRRWLKEVDFPHQRNDRYIQSVYIPGIGQKTYLVSKDMSLEKVSTVANPFSHLFSSVEEHVNASLKSLGLRFSKEQFLGSGKYESFSKHYQKPSYSSATAGTEFRFYSAVVSNSYLEDEGNWDGIFKRRWKDVFDQSNKEKAMNFFKDYGTHYVVKAVMGGRQETEFTVDHCKIMEKSTKMDYEIDLKRPYMDAISKQVDVQAYYRKSHLNIIIKDPTKCTGGNSLDLEVCHDLTLWRASVLRNPYPIKMTLKPFYSLVKGYEHGLWLKKMYEEYLKSDLGEVKINTDIKAKVKCEPRKASPLSPGEMAWIVFGSIILVLIACSCIAYRISKTFRDRCDDAWRDLYNKF